MRAVEDLTSRSNCEIARIWHVCAVATNTNGCESFWISGTADFFWRSVVTRNNSHDRTNKRRLKGGHSTYKTDASTLKVDGFVFTSRAPERHAADVRAHVHRAPVGVDQHLLSTNSGGSCRAVRKAMSVTTKAGFMFSSTCYACERNS